MTIKTQRLLARAKKILKKGEYEEAQKLYTTVLEASPNNQEAKDGLLALQQGKEQLSPPKAEIQSVFALYSNGQIQEALDSVETLIKDYPNEPLLYNISGACYKEIGQLEKAFKNFEKAVALKPGYAEAQYNLGITLRELGQVDAAIKCYENALAIKHAYPNVHNNLGHIFLGLSRLDEAVDHFEWAVAYQPDFFEAHNNLGNTLLTIGKLDDAVKSFQSGLAGTRLDSERKARESRRLRLGASRLGASRLGASRLGASRLGWSDTRLDRLFTWCYCGGD